MRRAADPIASSAFAEATGSLRGDDHHPGWCSAVASRGSLHQVGHDVIPLDLDLAVAEGEVEVEVPELPVHLPARDEVVEVQGVEAANVRRVDQVPRRAEDRHAQTQNST